MNTKEMIIQAGLVLWEAKGERAVTCRAIGRLIGISGQRVHALYGNMNDLRTLIAKRAVTEKRTGIILQMQADRHPLAPPIEGKSILK